MRTLRKIQDNVIDIDNTTAPRLTSRYIQIRSKYICIYFRKKSILFECTMANSESSSDEGEVPTAARLPTQVRTTNSPFRKFTKTKRKSSKSNHGDGNKSPERRSGTVSVGPKKKPKNQHLRVPSCCKALVGQQQESIYITTQCSRRMNVSR